MECNEFNVLFIYVRIFIYVTMRYKGYAMVRIN